MCEPEEDLSGIVRRIVEHYRPEKIILFGSRARGEADSKSDIDLAVIAETDKRFVQRLRESADVVPESGVDVLIYTPREAAEMMERKNVFMKRIVSEGRVIYEKSG